MRRPSPSLRALGWLVSWAVAAAAWLLLVDTTSIPELVAGAIAAAIAATGAVLARAQCGDRLRARPLAMARAAVRQLARVPTDLWLLARELGPAIGRAAMLGPAGPRRTGGFRSLPFEGADEPRANARRAGIELLGSLAPNTIVLGVDDRQVVVHQLASKASEARRLPEIGR